MSSTSVAAANVMSRMWVALSVAGATMFRNNVAQAVVGEITMARARGSVMLNPGDAVVRSARWLHAGLQKGSGDLIGWTEVVVTAEMVGQKVAVFTSVEAKHGSGRSTTEQKRWRKNVLDAGGFAGEARNDVDALAIIGK